MGAGGFHGRVRDGIGWVSPRHGHQVIQPIFRLVMRLVFLKCAAWMISVHGPLVGVGY